MKRGILIMAKRLFNVIKIEKNREELRTQYQEYLRTCKRMNYDPVSWEIFKSAPDLNTYVDMKCLNCGFGFQSQFGNYAMDMEEFSLPFPIDWCPNCNLRHLVPKDICDKLLDE
jgi:hypothetical protein